MSNQQILDNIASLSMYFKNSLCEEQGGPADGSPMILGADMNGENFVIPDVLDGHPTDNLPIILSSVMEGLREKNDSLKWDWIAYVVEGYTNSAENPEDYERGAMEQDFKNNPSSTVREAVIVTLYTWENESACRTLMYTYGDDGMPIWSEPTDADEPPAGIVPFILETFRKFCQNDGDLSKLMGMN